MKLEQKEITCNSGKNKGIEEIRERVHTRKLGRRGKEDEKNNLDSI